MPSGKLNTSASSWYEYNWGFCSLSGQQQVICGNSDNEYQVHYNFSTTGAPGTRLYIAHCVQDSAISSQLCKNEVGKTKGTKHTEENYTSWKY